MSMIEKEMKGKFQSIQSATAIRVLKRFYKNITFKDQGIQIEDDPVNTEI